LVEAGHFALALALGLSLIQLVVPLWGARANDPVLMAVAPTSALAVLACIAFSFIALTSAYLNSDFSVLNVVQNSHSAKPLIYKISGVWGNHEGSMLLWVLILALFGGVVALARNSVPLRLQANTLAVQASITIAFLLFILTTSNPFTRVIPAPLEGQDLNPLLQDPGLAIHPPLLYIGYVGFSISFAFACAALDPRRLGFPDARNRHGLVLGLLRARLGRLVVLGSGGKRLAHAVARGHRARAFDRRDGKARCAESLDHPSRHPDLLPVAAGHLPRPLRRADLGPFLRGRS
jgi:cytochrome c biogenesis factor